MMKYVPKGGMCASCVKRDYDCSVLKFENMLVIESCVEFKVVKCSEYERMSLCSFEINLDDGE